MISGHDFSGYQVLVVGGTRGEGHAIAGSFADAGASVTVTGLGVRVRVTGQTLRLS